MNIDSSNIIIHVTTHNRKKITEICLAQLKQYKQDALLWVHDDGSSEYDIDWLNQFGDIVTTLRNPHTFPNQRSTFAVLHSLQLAKKYADENPQYTHVYHTDNDMFHDPDYIKALCKYWNKYKTTIVLFTEKNYGRCGPDRTIPHVPVLEKYDDGFRSCWGQGASWLFLLSHINKFDANFNGSWDGHINDLMGQDYIHTIPNYADHYTFHGVHSGMNPENFALYPSPYLENIRPQILQKLGIS